MSYQASGTLYRKFDAEQVTQRFRKREFVLELSGRYPQYVTFQLTGDSCEALDPFEVGAELVVDFRLRGREWTGRDGDVRYFNSLDVLEVRAVEDSAEEDLLDPVPPPADGDAPVFDEDELPF